MHYILLLVALAGGARAKAAVAEKVTAARAACAAGRVEEGIELLAQIVAETGDPNALYNQGRCYQQNGRTEQAIQRFREYLRTSPSISAADKLRVRGYIGELEADLENKARREALARAAAAENPSVPPPPPAPIAPPPVAVAPPAPAPIAPPPVAAAPVVTAPEESAPTPGPSGPPPTWLRPTSVVLAAVGVASLGAAAYFTYQTSKATSDLEAPGRISATQYRDRYNEGRRDELFARLGYGLGGAALVGSLVLYLVSRHDDSEGRVSLAPLLGPGGAGGLVAVRY